MMLVFDCLFVGKTDLRGEPEHATRMSAFNDAFNRKYGIHFPSGAHDSGEQCLSALRNYLKQQRSALENNKKQSKETQRQIMVMNKFFAYPSAEAPPNIVF